MLGRCYLLIFLNVSASFDWGVRSSKEQNLTMLRRFFFLLAPTKYTQPHRTLKQTILTPTSMLNCYMLIVLHPHSCIICLATVQVSSTTLFSCKLCLTKLKDDHLKYKLYKTTTKTEMYTLELLRLQVDIWLPSVRGRILCCDTYSP